MEWLNYHHLFYFWHVAREGGLMPAGRVLRLSHPTLSAQIKALERRLAAPLFRKEGRRLVLTDTGRVVFRYADEIFSLGREMVNTVEGSGTGAPVRLVVGVADAVPKVVVRRLLQPALALRDPVRLICHEGDFTHLLTELALHHLDVVISDAPVPPGSPIRAFTHLLAECGITFFATPALAGAKRQRFPASLHGAPMVLPVTHLPLRRALDAWFDREGVRPNVVVECEDSALLKEFGADGVGIFPGPTTVEAQIVKQYGVRIVGRTTDVTERFYAISAERRIKHQAVGAVVGQAEGRANAVRI